MSIQEGAPSVAGTPPCLHTMLRRKHSSGSSRPPFRNNKLHPLTLEQLLVRAAEQEQQPEQQQELEPEPERGWGQREGTCPPSCVL